jgi:hypothetical protein
MARESAVTRSAQDDNFVGALTKGKRGTVPQGRLILAQDVVLGCYEKRTAVPKGRLRIPGTSVPGFRYHATVAGKNSANRSS